MPQPVLQNTSCRGKRQLILEYSGIYNFVQSYLFLYLAMMKHLYYIAALAATFLTAMPLHAQEEVENEATQQQQTRRRSPQASRGERNDKKDTGLPELTVRAQDMNERLTQEIGNARWMRIIYRQVDLMKEQNAPFYTRPAR